jgi:cytochrome b561
MGDAPAEVAARWTALHKLLHWVVAIAVLVQIYLGFQLDDLAATDPARLRTLSLHASTGVAIFALTLVRLAWRLGHPAPPPPATLGPVLARASVLVHRLLYVLLLVVPVSGLVLVASAGSTLPLVGGLSLPGFGPLGEGARAVLWYLHTGAALATCVLVLLHVAGALRHAVHRDGTLSRMLPGG